MISNCEETPCNEFPRCLSGNVILRPQGARVSNATSIIDCALLFSIVCLQQHLVCRLLGVTGTSGVRFTPLDNNHKTALDIKSTLPYRTAKNEARRRVTTPLNILHPVPVTLTHDHRAPRDLSSPRSLVRRNAAILDYFFMHRHTAQNAPTLRTAVLEFTATARFYNLFDCNTALKYDYKLHLPTR